MEKGISSESENDKLLESEQEILLTSRTEKEERCEHNITDWWNGMGGMDANTQGGEMGKW